MSEFRYGRLFTEADVEKLIRAAYEQGYDDCGITGTIEGYDHVVLSTLVESDGPMTFPADEPLFLLRAQDKAAPDAIASDPATAERLHDYYEAAYAARLPLDEEADAHLLAVKRAAEAMRAWQAANPDRVKVPD